MMLGMVISSVVPLVVPRFFVTIENISHAVIITKTDATAKSIGKSGERLSSTSSSSSSSSYRSLSSSSSLSDSVSFAAFCSGALGSDTLSKYFVEPSAEKYLYSNTMLGSFLNSSISFIISPAV